MGPYFHDQPVFKLTGKRRKGRAVWTVYEPIVFTYYADDGDPVTVSVPAGEETDFASVPRIFWRIIPPGGVYSGAAAVHDWHYKHRIHEDTLGRTNARKLADYIFNEAMKAAGVKGWRRGMMYRAVRLGGAGGWGS